MLIEGPFKLSVKDSERGLGHELHLDFTEAFREKISAEQVAALRQHIGELNSKAAELAEDNSDRQGMPTVAPFTEQLLPHVAQDEIPLEEPLVIEISPHMKGSLFALAAADGNH